jgi:DNA-directed RNA polymerase specialized sigma24 family protein
MPEMSQTADDVRRHLGSSELRSLLEGFVRRRVPPSEVDDLVQTVLIDALEAETAPGDLEGVRRWVVGIARHKVADFHRRNGRAAIVALPEQLVGEEPPISARQWARWASQQTADDPEAQRTLDWMAREGDGEKLAHIAADEALPATQVRQRVSRLRRHLRERWKAELAAVAILLLVAIVAWRFVAEPTPQVITPSPDRVSPERPEAPRVVPEPPPLDNRGRAAELRRVALEACDSAAWQPCLDGLNEAKQLDPAGDGAEAVRRAREAAERALTAEDAIPGPTAPPTKPLRSDDGRGPHTSDAPQPTVPLVPRGYEDSPSPAPTDLAPPKSPSAEGGKKKLPAAPPGEEKK